MRTSLFSWVAAGTVGHFFMGILLMAGLARRDVVSRKRAVALMAVNAGYLGFMAQSMRRNLLMFESMTLLAVLKSQGSLTACCQQDG